MKKSVILLIFVIYVASIVIIGFFGVKIGSYNPTIYVSSIEILNEELKINSNNEKYIVIYFEEFDDLNDNPNYVQLQTKVWPENATYRNVDYIYSESEKVSVTAIGTVVFTQPTTVTIYITSQDGTNLREILTISARVQR